MQDPPLGETLELDVSSEPRPDSTQDSMLESLPESYQSSSSEAGPYSAPSDSAYLSGSFPVNSSGPYPETDSPTAALDLAAPNGVYTAESASSALVPMNTADSLTPYGAGPTYIELIPEIVPPVKRRRIPRLALIISAAVFTIILGVLIFFIVSQTTSYNDAVAALSQQVEDCRTELFAGTDDDTMGFEAILAGYQQKLASFDAFGPTLESMNSDPHYFFVFSKKDETDVGIDALENEVADLQVAVDEAQLVLDGIQTARQKLGLIAKTSDTTMDDVLAEFEQFEGLTADLHSQLKGIDLPDDLEACRSNVENAIDSLQSDIDTSKSYFIRLRSVEQAILSFNASLEGESAVNGLLLRDQIKAYEQTCTIINRFYQELDSVNSQPEYANVVNKVDMAVMGLSAKSQELLDISHQVDTIKHVLDQSDTLENDIDTLDIDKATAEDLIARNNKMIDTLRTMDMPGMFASSVSVFISALEKRGEALNEYIAYLAEYAKYLTYVDDADYYWKQCLYYYDWADWYYDWGYYSTAYSYYNQGDIYYEKAEDAEDEANAAAARCQEHADNFMALRDEYREMMGLYVE